MRYNKSSSKREALKNTIIPQETRKISSRQPNLTLKIARKEEKTEPKVSTRKEVTKTEEIKMFY